MLVEINHPAQVHKLKNLIFKLREHNNVIVMSRDKECTVQLLNDYGIKHHVVSKQRKAKLFLAWELFLRSFFALVYIIKYRPKYMFGFSAINLCLLGKLFGIKTILLADTEDAGWISRLTFPFAWKIVIPETFKRSFPGRELRFKGTHELSYLIDFKPDQSVYSLLKIYPADKFVVLRFVSWQAVHDVSEKGLVTEQKKRLIELLEKNGFKVFISAEGELFDDFARYKIAIPPSKIHHAMYYAELFIGDSQSMATEAALLGTPSIRYSSLVGKMHGLGQYNELQEKKLVYSVNNSEEFSKIVQMVVSLKNRKKIWQKRKDDYLKDKINPADLVMDLMVKGK